MIAGPALGDVLVGFATHGHYGEGAEVVNHCVEIYWSCGECHSDGNVIVGWDGDVTGTGEDCFVGFEVIDC